MNAAELYAEMNRLHELHDKATRQFRDQWQVEAGAERDYRKRRAECWATAEGTAQERKDLVDAMTADLRFTRDSASGLRRSAFEALHNYRDQMMLLRMVGSAYKAEADFDRTGPQVTP